MKIEDYFEQIRQTPSLAYPILLGIAVFVLVGIILDWDWLLDPQGDSKLRLQLEIWGRKNVRIFFGIGLFIINVFLLYLIFFT